MIPTEETTPRAEALLELIGKLEGAMEGSRELDWRIAWVLGNPMMANARDDFFPPFMPGSRADKTIATFTTSIDAALALIERKLPGWTWGVYLNSAGTYTGDVEASYEGDEEGCGTGESKAPAVALCIALLKALSDGRQSPQEKSDETTLSDKY